MDEYAARENRRAALTAAIQWLGHDSETTTGDMLATAAAFAAWLNLPTAPTAPTGAEPVRAEPVRAEPVTPGAACTCHRHAHVNRFPRVMCAEAGCYCLVGSDQGNTVRTPCTCLAHYPEDAAVEECRICGHFSHARGTCTGVDL